MLKLGVNAHGGKMQDIGDHLSDPPALLLCIKLLAWVAGLRREEWSAPSEYGVYGGRHGRCGLCLDMF